MGTHVAPTCWLRSSFHFCLSPGGWRIIIISSSHCSCASVELTARRQTGGFRGGTTRTSSKPLGSLSKRVGWRSSNLIMHSVRILPRGPERRRPFYVRTRCNGTTQRLTTGRLFQRVRLQQQQNKSSVFYLSTVSWAIFVLLSWYNPVVATV